MEPRREPAEYQRLDEGRPARQAQAGQGFEEARTLNAGTSLWHARRMAALPARVNAEPALKRGPYAAWDLADIPPGINRGQCGRTPGEAFKHLNVTGFSQHQRVGDQIVGKRLYGVVLWADLQPLKPVPRGREAMTAAQWGTTRDADGVCTICEADDSMWCDHAPHWPQEVRETLVVGTSVSKPQIASPPARVRPPDTFSLAACTGEMIDRRGVSQLARELWAGELAELVRKGEAQDQERERNRVLVDLEFEPWE